MPKLRKTTPRTTTQSTRSRRTRKKSRFAWWHYLVTVVLVLIIAVGIAWVARNYWLSPIIKTQMAGWQPRAQAWIAGLLGPNKQKQIEIHKRHEQKIAEIRRTWAPMVSQKEVKVRNLQAQIQLLQNNTPKI